MSLPFYSFLPWARRGIASLIQEVDNFGGAAALTDATQRAEIQTYVHISTDGAATPPVNVNLNIIGPGDIIGIHPDAIVRTEPLNWITNFEPHAFPFIEFYEEDFPWRYTPAKAADSDKRLRPWLSLVVLKEDEFDRHAVDGAPLSAFKINSNLAPSAWPLPKHDELWAWAHVSVNDALSGGNKDQKVASLENRLKTNPDLAISRIICPRQLEENTSYYAFLIPTFETGRLAGLGKNPSTVKAQAPAWNHSQAPSTTELGTFPIFYEWYFRTGATGDFEYLVSQVKPKVLDARVGKRLMDIQAPGYGLTYQAGTPGSTAGTMMLEGALRAPTTVATPIIEPYKSPNSSRSLKDFINLGEDLLSNAANAWKTEVIGGFTAGDDPVITPPLYGRWHALKRKLNSNNNNDWINDLNLDPRNRMAASLGGEYVRKNQEYLMDKAWTQVGDVLEGNKRARLAQLAMETTKAMSAKHFSTQPLEQLVSMTNNVHSKIKSTSGFSIKQDLLYGQLPDGATSNAFRRIRRPTGVLMKRIDPNSSNYFNQTLVSMSQSAANSPAAGKTAPNATTFQMANMNFAMSQIQQYPNVASMVFSITSPTPPPSGPPTSPNSTVASNFQAVVTGYNNVYSASNWAAPGSLPDVLAPSQFEQDIITNIAPANVFPRSFSIAVNNNVLYGPVVPDVIVPAMTAPKFFISMYKSLQELGLDYFIPNLNLIPQNSITLLETNSKFIESFLVGANYEMGRELLWREYPTDQRGTYFHHFWESSDSVKPTNMTDAQFEVSVRDITNIDTWLSTDKLGTHSGRTATTNNLVLAIRGDFLKKFPTAVVYAIEAEWQITNGQVDYLKNRVKRSNAQPLYPIYSASIEPDITFLGFDLTREMAIGLPPVTVPPTPQPTPRLAGYYFVIMERPGELRFGLDYTPNGAPVLNNWNNLSWSHVLKTSSKHLELNLTSPLIPLQTSKLPPSSTAAANTVWGEDSAAMAMITYQNPVMVMIHAREMLL